jgi:hypothetical protein
MLQKQKFKKCQNIPPLLPSAPPSIPWLHPLPHLRLPKKNGKRFFRFLLWRTISSLKSTHEKIKASKGDHSLLDVEVQNTKKIPNVRANTKTPVCQKKIVRVF